MLNLSLVKILDYRLLRLKPSPAFPTFQLLMQNNRHCPNQSNHEYVKRVDTGSYVRLEDVIKILTVGEDEDE